MLEPQTFQYHSNEKCGDIGRKEIKVSHSVFNYSELFGVNFYYLLNILSGMS